VPAAIVDQAILDEISQALTAISYAKGRKAGEAG
jgi:hypothetical protein